MECKEIDGINGNFPEEIVHAYYCFKISVTLYITLDIFYREKKWFCKYAITMYPIIMVQNGKSLEENIYTCINMPFCFNLYTAE